MDIGIYFSLSSHSAMDTEDLLGVFLGIEQVVYDIAWYSFLHVSYSCGLLSFLDLCS